MGANFRWLSGPEDWTQGGRWARRVSDTAYHLIELTPCDDEGTQTATLYQIDTTHPSAGRACESVGWRLIQTPSHGPPRIVEIDYGRIVAIGVDAVRLALLDAMASNVATVLCGEGGRNPTTIRRKLARKSLDMGHVSGPTSAVAVGIDARLNGTRCPECGETVCGEDCPAFRS